ncbi:hypothetical protein THASP1DRAFT_27392 [Thamnocephalis sphaerospora]|uniref:F-box domain-containing protein n=1 Tax=Thamnocephalis sphaerospora TaxID=78915 RepID=A0A4P9XWR3_9FUNG|nr:hypothetical protein THASP1DRAFT_27392 [Thamnocephalis sphaerospora]|eukprot:RKP10853.1 hypothetical protein THASP1DRAFT_27392 [Thamnocephalis sphaerospora]
MSLVPDEVWLRIFVYATQDSLSVQPRLQCVNRHFHKMAGYADRDWQTLLKRECILEKHWGSGGVCEDLRETTNDEEEEGSNERDQNARFFKNHHVRYLCRLKELNDRQLQSCDPLAARPKDIEFSRFLISDFTSADAGIVAIGTQHPDSYRNDVTAWHFPTNDTVFQTTLLPDNDGTHEQLLEIGWLAQLMVTAVQDIHGNWKELRVYDIAQEPRQRVSQFQIDYNIRGSGVYILPSWLHLQLNPNARTEVLVVGIETDNGGRGVIIRHDILTQRTHTFFLRPRANSAFCDSRFPDIALTSHNSSGICIWSTVTGAQLHEIAIPDTHYVYRIGLSSAIEAAPTKLLPPPGTKSTDSGAGQMCMGGDRAIRLVAAVGYRQSTRIQVWNLVTPNLEFAFPADVEPEALVAPVQAILLRTHPYITGYLSCMRVVGRMLFAIRSHMGFTDLSYASAFNLETGDEIYRTALAPHLRNMMQIGHELLVLSRDEIYTVGPKRVLDDSTDDQDDAAGGMQSVVEAVQVASGEQEQS